MKFKKDILREGVIVSSKAQVQQLIGENYPRFSSIKYNLNDERRYVLILEKDNYLNDITVGRDVSEVKDAVRFEDAVDLNENQFLEIMIEGWFWNKNNHESFISNLRGIDFKRKAPFMTDCGDRYMNFSITYPGLIKKRYMTTEEIKQFIMKNPNIDVLFEKDFSPGWFSPYRYSYEKDIMCYKYRVYLDFGDIPSRTRKFTTEY